MEQKRKINKKLVFVIVLFTIIGTGLKVFEYQIGYLIGSINDKYYHVPLAFTKENMLGEWGGDMPIEEFRKSDLDPDHELGGSYTLTLNEDDTFTLTDDIDGVLMDEGTYLVIEDTQVAKNMVFYDDAGGEVAYYGYLFDFTTAGENVVYLYTEEQEIYYVGVQYYDFDTNEFNEEVLENMTDEEIANLESEHDHD